MRAALFALVLLAPSATAFSVAGMDVVEVDQTNGICVRTFAGGAARVSCVAIFGEVLASTDPSQAAACDSETAASTRGNGEVAFDSQNAGAHAPADDACEASINALDEPGTTRVGVRPTAPRANVANSDAELLPQFAAPEPTKPPTVDTDSGRRNAAKDGAPAEVPPATVPAFGIPVIPADSLQVQPGAPPEAPPVHSLEVPSDPSEPGLGTAARETALPTLEAVPALEDHATYDPPASYDEESNAVSLDEPSNDPIVTNEAEAESPTLTVRSRVSDPQVVEGVAPLEAENAGVTPPDRRAEGAEASNGAPSPRSGASSHSLPRAGPSEKTPAPSPTTGTGHAGSVTGRVPTAVGVDNSDAVRFVLALAFSAIALAVVVLYSRLARKAVLGQAVRERILARIRESPGQTPAALAREIGVHDTTIRYHVRLLQREGLLMERAERGRLLYFLPGDPTAQAASTVAILQTDAARTILEAARCAPGMSVRDAVAASGVDRVTVHYHVKNLVAAGLLKVEREGRALRLFAA